jgi:hypothetical protein
VIARDIPGDTFSAANGSWALFQQKGRKLIVDGDVAVEGTATRMYAINGPWLAYLDTDGVLHLHLRENGVELGRWTIKGRLTGIRVTAQGLVTFRTQDGRTWRTSQDMAPIDSTVVKGESVLLEAGAWWVSVAGNKLIRRWRANGTTGVLVSPAFDTHFDAVALPKSNTRTITQDSDGSCYYCEIPPDAAEEPIIVAPPPPAVKPYAKHFWFGCYKDPQNECPRNVTLCVDGSNEFPATGSLVVDEARLVAGSALTPHRAAALYVESVGTDGNLADIEARALSVRAAWKHYGNNRPCPPVIAYVGSKVPTAPIPGVDVVLLEARLTDKVADPEAELDRKIEAALDAGLTFGFVLDSTDGALNGAKPPATDAQIAEWWASRVIAIREFEPACVFVWAWSREYKGVEHGLKAHPQARAWVRAIVDAIPKEGHMSVWGQAQTDLLVRFAQKFAPPTGGDDGARLWTHMAAEQFRYAFGPAWGTKAQSPAHPQSTDAIAYQGPEGFFACDTLFAAGSPDCKLNPHPEAIDITGQHFIAVEPMDHLGEEPPPEDLAARVDALEQQVAEFKAWRERTDRKLTRAGNSLIA